jgi:hypothetical protein
VLKQFAVAVALATLSTPIAKAETVSQTAGMPDVHTGDKWVYQSIDDITGEKKFEIAFVVTELNDKQIFVRATKNGAAGTQFIVYDRDWNLESDDHWRKMPNDGTGVRLPLAVGQEWRSKNRVQNLKTGSMFNATTSSKIVASEKVSTRAGTFDAFKIVMQVERIPVADPARHMEFTLTTWYAPAVKRMIKRTVVEKQQGHVRDSSTLELIQYSLK